MVRSIKASPAVAKPRRQRAPRFDGFTPSSASASATKRAVGRRDTQPEIVLRRLLWALGSRYRVNVATLPGCPDIVFPRARLVVFVDGDFWHGRNWKARKARLSAGSNSAYWIAKIRANMRRDRRQTRDLARSGWTVLRCWESEILTRPLGLAKRIIRLARGRADAQAPLRHGAPAIHSARPSPSRSPAPPME
jgi:DNA mismatch endonuclease (patch repair protein)